MEVKNRTNVLFGRQHWIRHNQVNWTTDPSPGIITQGDSLPLTSVEKTLTSGHAWPRGRAAKTDVGGNFTTSKVRSIALLTPGIFNGSRWAGQRYIGPAWPSSPYSAMDYAMSLITPASDFVLMQLGSTAISRCIPTNPVADGATFLGELRQLPKVVGKELLKSKFKDYRKVGSEYLNVEFGWKPIISDLKKFGQSVIESEKILEQLHRDSGKNIHRKYTFPDDVVESETVTTGRYCYLPSGIVLPTQLYDGSGTLTVRTKVTTSTWFSGCFTYHLNLGKTLPERISRSAAEARKLYGLELTPEVVWNLTPWSWALDWEGSIGDVLHNVSRFSQDGLVMRYGYIMQSKTAEVEYTLRRGGPLTGLSNGDLRMTVTSQSKVRRRATPFGFGFDMTALTGRQSAILGALGISRGPRHL
jgi:hypothetical protein